MHLTSHILQGSRTARPCILGDPVSVPVEASIVLEVVDLPYILLVIVVTDWTPEIQGHQLIMSVFFWYITGKSDLSSTSR